MMRWKLVVGPSMLQSISNTVALLADHTFFVSPQLCGDSSPPPHCCRVCSSVSVSQIGNGSLKPPLWLLLCFERVVPAVSLWQRNKHWCVFLSPEFKRVWRINITLLRVWDKSSPVPRIINKLLLRLTLLPDPEVGRDRVAPDHTCNIRLNNIRMLRNLGGGWFAACATYFTLTPGLCTHLGFYFDNSSHSQHPLRLIRLVTDCNFDPITRNHGFLA